MIGRKKLAVGVGALVVATSSLCLLTTSAYADYAPSGNDVVGVGSDTVQAAADFVADGDVLGDGGYNTGKLNKFISIDATADANTRLAYGSTGIGLTAPGTATCVPGTGGTAGTGNQNTTHTETTSPVCALNPTVVLRAGLSPVQRPNGSGAGFNLLKADTDATTGKSINNLVDFSRASSKRSGGANFDSLTIGTDPLGMLVSASTHAVPLTAAQLKSIYNCTITDWSTLGGTAGTIKPLLPQVGSGTRNYFLDATTGIGVSNPGTCVQNVEENDPEAIDASGDPANAIEPMSQSRLFLFQGKLSDGSPTGVGGYFTDPSCAGLATTPASCVSPTNTLNPNVKLFTSADNQNAYYPTRPLYIYFRHADINSTKKFQPGGTLNWVRTMLYNPGGLTPYFCSGAGQADISAAGIIPACSYVAGGP